MKLHPNAKTTPKGRQALVARVREQHWSISETAGAAGVSIKTVYKWLARYHQEGPAGLQDRSSRPHRMPTCTPASKVRRIQALRHRRLAAWEIAERVPVPVSTISRILKRLGLGRLWQLEPEQKVQRYEREVPGELVHMDTKKLARIRGVGHRIHGNRQRRARGVGWEFAHVCVDDFTRLAYTEVRSEETADAATAFFRRAVAWFRRKGIEIQRLMTDNAKCYTSHQFRNLCGDLKIRQLFTRPYTPRTNGKAERFIQTMTRRWAYRKPYRSSAERTRALPEFTWHYNHRRPHRALGKKTPMDRLRETREQRV